MYSPIRHLIAWVLVIAPCLGCPLPAASQDALMERAEAHMNASAFSEAVAAYEQALAADPAQGIAWFRMGMALHELQRWDDAAAAYRKAIELNTQILSAQWRLGRVLALDGDVGGAMEALEAMAANGFGAVARITDDPELDGIRSHPRYASLLQSIRVNADPCRNTAMNRQFDFWVGEWDVVSPQGQPLGENRVELVMRDCALLEHWTNVGGRSGTSLNVVDASQGAPSWRQLYVSDFGGVTDYRNGVFEDDVMTFTAQVVRANGDTLTRRMRFIVMTQDSVHQIIDDAQADGTWAQQFFGIYVRRDQSAEPASRER